MYALNSNDTMNDDTYVNCRVSNCAEPSCNQLRFTHKLKGGEKKVASKSHIDSFRTFVPQGNTNVKQKKVDSTFQNADSDSKLVYNLKMSKNC